MGGDSVGARCPEVSDFGCLDPQPPALPLPGLGSHLLLVKQGIFSWQCLAQGGPRLRSLENQQTTTIPRSYPLPSSPSKEVAEGQHWCHPPSRMP